MNSSDDMFDDLTPISEDELSKDDRFKKSKVKGNKSTSIKSPKKSEDLFNDFTPISEDELSKDDRFKKSTVKKKESNSNETPSIKPPIKSGDLFNEMKPISEEELSKDNRKLHSDITPEKEERIKKRFSEPEKGKIENEEKETEEDLFADLDFD